MTYPVKHDYYTLLRPTKGSMIAVGRAVTRDKSSSGEVDDEVKILVKEREKAKTCESTWGSTYDRVRN